MKQPIVCENCMSLHDIHEVIQERVSQPTTYPLVEGISVCPDCRYEKHIYFLDQETRNKRSDILGKIKIFSQRRSQENLNRVIELKKELVQVYDDCQQRYLHLLQKDAGSDDTTT
jgi:hypothetical protein